jgi:hypothetical protein
VSAGDLLLEGSGTNLLTYSEDFSNAAWDATSSATKVSATGVDDPAGGTTASTWRNDGTTVADGGIRRTVSGTSGLTYTYSAWIRRRTGTGDIFMVVGQNVDFDVTSQVTSEWNRISVTNTADANTRGYIFIKTPGDEIDIWGAQLEANSYATSYIPTSGSTATRAADVSTSAATFGNSWYEQSAGTVAISWNKPWSGDWPNYQSLFRVIETANSAENFISYGLTNGANNQIYWSAKTSNVPQLDYKQYPASGPGKFKHAMAVTTNDAAFAHDGDISGRTDDSITLPTVDRAQINAVNSHVSRITYWPTRLSDDTLQTITV